jgi:microcystin-dependent protein
MPVFGGDTPVGAGMIWYTNTAPANWLICDGSSLNRADYPKLFGVIGTTYGSVSGTTFSLPDLRQRFPMGKAASGTGNTLAGTGGAVDHAHTSPAHTHTVPAHYHGMGTGADLNITSSGSHTHTFGIYAITSGGGSSAGVAAQGGSGGPTFYSISTDSHTHASGAFAGKIGLVTGGVDGNAAMTSGSTTPSNTGTNNPPYLVVNYIIKAA